MAPGGHLGRLIVWTKDAFKSLNDIFGNYRRKDIQKHGYILARNVMTCADLARIINSDQVQSKLRLIKTSKVAHDFKKKNPLKNRALMKKLNPFDAVRRAQEQKDNEERHKKRSANLKALRKEHKKATAARSKAFNGLQDGLAGSFKQAEHEWLRVGGLLEEESGSEEADE